jgi:hypothetical protein
MGFLDVVAELRAQLGVDNSLPVAAAVQTMSEMMGLEWITETGRTIPLPAQVEALCESLNFSMPLGTTCDRLEESTEDLQEEEKLAEDDTCKSPHRIKKQRKFSFLSATKANTNVFLSHLLHLAMLLRYGGFVFWARSA